MTQKSYARKMRDMEEKRLKDEAKRIAEDNTPIWDEINGLYVKYCNLLNSNVAFMGILRESGHLLPFYKEPGMLANYVNTLTKDHNELNERLQNIHAKHADKSGRHANGDEMALAFGLGSEYSIFGEHCIAILDPTLAQIRSYVTEAEKAYNLSLENTDVSVVTEVQFKEEPITVTE